MCAVSAPSVIPPEVERHSARTALTGLLSLAVLVAVAFVAGAGDPADWEIRVFRSINHLPGTLSAPLTGAMQFGALAAVAVAGGAAAVGRRRRLARAVMVAGTASWILAKVLNAAVGRRRPDEILDQVVVRGRVIASSFPSTHGAVAAALAVVAAPYLGRVGRRLSVLGAIAVGISRVYVGAQFPLDAVGGLLLGATVSFVYTYVAGAPARRLSAAQIASALASRSIVVGHLQPWPRALPGSRFVGHTDTGPVLVVITGLHEPGRSWTSLAWKFLAFRDTAGLRPLRSPRELNEHAALMSVLAERSGVRTTRLRYSGDVGPEHSLSIYQLPEGSHVGTLPPEQVNDGFLRATWEELNRLHEAGIVLALAGPDDITVDGDNRPCLVNLADARLTTSRDDRSRDVARTFAVLLPFAEPDRIAHAAAHVLDIDILADAAAHLHPLAIPTSLRQRLGERDDVLARSRRAIAAATATTEVTVIGPARTALRNLGLLAAGAIAVYLLLGQVGQAKQTIRLLRTPNPGWIAATGVAMVCTYLAAAVALMGSTTMHLPLRRTLSVQFAATFSNRLAPAGLGGMATNVRYLERAGSERPAALAAITVNTLAGLIVHVIAIAAVLPAAGPISTVDIDPPRYWPALVAVMATMSIGGVIVLIRFLPANIGARVRAALRSLADVLTSPPRALAVFAGSAGITATHVAALYCSMRAFGSHIPITDVTAVYLGASAIAATSPTPGGLGALEAGLVAGLAHVGVPASIAVVGVLTYRLVTYWIPVLPGAFAFRSLRARRLL